jgi:hypothetical protein
LTWFWPLTLITTMHLILHQSAHGVTQSTLTLSEHGHQLSWCRWRWWWKILITTTPTPTK